MRLPRPPAAVVFDLDGTLIDSESLVRAAYAAAGAQFGVAIDPDQFRVFVGKTRDVTRALLLQFYGDDFPVEDFRVRVTQEIGERRAPLKPGTLPLLDRIAALGLPAAVCTSSGSPWAHRHIDGHGIAARFRAVVTRDDVARGKPDPEPYLTVAALLGVAPAEILVVEDSPTGLASAHAAGTMPVLVPDLVPPTEACLGRAVYVARSLEEVQERFFSPA